MEHEVLDRFKKWARDLPRTRMVWPDSWGKRLKYAFWRVYTPMHTYLRDLALKLRVVWQAPGRQAYLIGKVSPQYDLQQVVQHLVDNGYANHFVAWQDEDEVLSLRYVDSFEYQYHVRIYRDGEIRGHYEYTPECHPYWHMQEVGMEDRRDHFLALLGDRIVPHIA